MAQEETNGFDDGTRLDELEYDDSEHLVDIALELLEAYMGDEERLDDEFAIDKGKAARIRKARRASYARRIQAAQINQSPYYDKGQDIWVFCKASDMDTFSDCLPNPSQSV
jgi:hypothetical protein